MTRSNQRITWHFLLKHLDPISCEFGFYFASSTVEIGVLSTLRIGYLGLY